MSRTKSFEGIAFKFPSKRSEMKRVLLEVEAYLDKCKCKAKRRVIIVLRELLDNALRYGNKYETQRYVRCSVSNIRKNQITIVVEDEGTGFDHTALDLQIPEDPRDLEHRGYKLVSALCKTLKFNEKGNRITVRIPMREVMT